MACSADSPQSAAESARLPHMPFITGPRAASSVATFVPAVRPSGAARVYPLSRSQEGIWIEYLMEPQSSRYNLTLRVDIDQQADEYDGSLSSVVAAIHSVTQKHGVLRSTVHIDDATRRPVMVEHAAESAAPLLSIITKMTTTDGSARLDQLLRPSFDLSREFSVRWIIILDGSKIEVFAIAHHIVMDGAAMSMLSADIFKTLQRSRPEESVDQTQKAVAFSNAYLRETEWSQTPAYEDACAFWLSQVTGTSPIVWKHSAPKPLANENYRAIDSWAEFSKEVLTNLSNKYKTSWFRVAVATIGLVIRSESKSQGSSFSLNVAFGGRPPGFDNVLGHFANALPLKFPDVPLHSDGTNVLFSALVKDISRKYSQAKKHERFANIDIYRAARGQGAQIPPSQVAITLSPKLSRPECCLYPVEGNWDLFICFLEGDDTVSLGVIYDPRKFSAQNVQHLKELFLPLFAEVQRSDIVETSSIPGLIPSPTVADLGSIPLQFLHRAFEDQAARSRDAIAVQCAERGETISYGALSALSNQRAHYLRSLGVGKEKAVLLHIERNVSVISWILATLKAGAAYVVLDKTHPAERKKHICDIVRPTVVVHDGANAVEGLLSDCSAIMVDAITLDVAKEEVSNLDVDVSEKDLAYIIFTSGSTGLPKGVMIEHGNIAHFIPSARQYTHIDAQSRVLQFAPFSFDGSVLEMSLALSSGATLCFAEHPRVLMGDYLADVIELNGISMMQITPSVLSTLPTERAYPSLKHISVGGETPSNNILETWRRRTTVVNDYGPTEATIAVTAKIQIGDANSQAIDGTTVGPPHQGTTIFICDSEFKRVLENGEDGEVCVGGPQVGRGYMGQEKLTAERFAVHPANGVRMYRTGDRGRILANREVQLMGRMDREVKVRGYRMDLPEIERAIHECENTLTAVSAQVDIGGTVLRAFIAPMFSGISHLRKRLQSRLPSYMVPSEIYALPSLPLNVSDKVDHKRISSLQDSLIQDSLKDVQEISDKLQAAPAFKAVASAVVENAASGEQTISQIWMSLLELKETPSVDTNFFDMGGNSLLVPALTDSLRKAYPDCSIICKDLFHASTISSQLRLIEERLLASSVAAMKCPTRGEKGIFQPPKAQSEAIHQRLSELWREVLNIKHVEMGSNFFDLGGHSLLVPRLLQAIKKTWPDADISLVTLFHQSTLEQQVSLLEKLVPSDYGIPTAPLTQTPPCWPATSLSSPPAYSCSTQIAIVGIAGRFPGADDIDAFYKLLSEGGDGVTTFPSETPANIKLPGGAIYVPRRGVVRDVEGFDHEMWKLSKEEATDMDPQQRLFMDTARSALEDAGFVPTQQERNNVGIFVGAAVNTYHTITEATYGDAFFRQNRAVVAPSISARTAYHLNLQGPNVTLNVNCASGTVALSLAVDHLNSGSCDMAVAGSVAIQFPQQGYVTEKGQIFSASGECRPFDHRSDGTVPSDAVCAFILKRLPDALADNDAIYGVIHGVGIGSDGHAEKAGLAVPSPRGQAEVIKAAWKKADVSSAALRYVELHGSGTPIGDALELEGLRLALTDLQGSVNGCTVGSNKGNVGNCQHTSGMVSLIKLCKSLQHGVIPPIRNLEKRSPLLADVPFNFAMEPVRIACGDILAVSCAGWGGVNSHVVLGAPPEGYARALDLKRQRKERKVQLLRAPRTPLYDNVA
ncbi:hypothetical protein B0H19DRAFT_73896 [Mycena capillaripes]|nr:hypothetical protein B0H19DRAFT_73896 [Mycena capillaripes]